MQRSKNAESIFLAIIELLQKLFKAVLKRKEKKEMLVKMARNGDDVMRYEGE